MKKVIYFMLLFIILCFIFSKNKVEIMFVNSATEKNPKLTVYIDDHLQSEFFCDPGSFPDVTILKLHKGVHKIQVVSSSPEKSWQSEFWVLSNEYYQFRFSDNMGSSDSLIIDFDRTFFRPLYQ